MADVSQRLLTKLEEALNGKDFDQQVIGELSCEPCHKKTCFWLFFGGVGGGFLPDVTQTRLYSHRRLLEA